MKAGEDSIADRKCTLLQGFRQSRQHPIEATPYSGAKIGHRTARRYGSRANGQQRPRACLCFSNHGRYSDGISDEVVALPRVMNDYMVELWSSRGRANLFAVSRIVTHSDKRLVRRLTRRSTRRWAVLAPAARRFHPATPAPAMDQSHHPELRDVHERRRRRRQAHAPGLRADSKFLH